MFMRAWKRQKAIICHSLNPPPPVNQLLQCTAAMNRSFRAPLSPLSLKNHHEKSSALQKAAMPRLTKTFRFFIDVKQSKTVASWHEGESEVKQRQGRCDI